jgi:hypothetical protein
MWDAISGKFLEELPKALLGLLVPLAQFIWKKIKEGGVREKKRSLRERIVQLSAQRESLGKVSGLPDGARILQDLDSELQATLAELAAMGISGAGQRSDDGAGGEIRREPSQRPALARWFLAYTPSGAKAWIVHSLFFVSLSLVLIGIVTTVVEAAGEEDWGPLWFVVIFLIPTLFLRWFALWLERPRSSADNPKWSWIPMALFWFVVVLIPIEWMLSAGGEDLDFSIEQLQREWPRAAYHTVFFLLVAICAYGWAHSRVSGPRRPLGKLRSALLLFVPSRPVGWIALFSWFAGWAMVLRAAYLVLSRGKDNTPRGLEVIALGYLLSAWKWAQSFRPPIDSRDDSNRR